jgi:hypothetical protein
VQPNAFFNDVVNDGTINIDAGSGATFYGTFSGAHGISGGGTAFFDGPVSPGQSAARVNFDGNVNFHDTASVVEELGGLTRGSQYDAIDIAGHVTLAGTIGVREINGFVPLPGQTFGVMSFASRDGDITVLNQTQYEGLRFTKTYTGTTLALTASAMPGDTNLSGIVDTLDFNALAANFGGTGKNWLQADFNADGVVDTLDFNSLAANFGKETSPQNPVGALVPEPTCGFVAVIALALTGASRRRRRTTPA